MALKSKGRIIQLSSNKIGIYIPVKIHDNSAFPFKSKEDVIVKIEGSKLIIEPFRECYEKKN
ncbi:MAG: hypothetical protein ACPLZG_10875 [Thermoproteota archaeon]|jgi:hypothetical protein